MEEGQLTDFLCANFKDMAHWTTDPTNEACILLFNTQGFPFAEVQFLIEVHGFQKVARPQVFFYEKKLL